MQANGGRPLPPAQLLQLRDTDHPRPIVLVAPPSPPAGSQPAPTASATPTPTQTPTPTPSVRTSPGRPLMPDRHVMPVSPATSALPAPSATVLGSPAPPSPAASPVDRRVIPERSSEFRSGQSSDAAAPLPVPSREAAPTQQQFERAPLPAAREGAPPAPPPPPPKIASPSGLR
jgi:hypothetical protein